MNFSEGSSLSRVRNRTRSVDDGSVVALELPSDEVTKAAYPPKRFVKMLG